MSDSGQEFDLDIVNGLVLLDVVLVSGVFVLGDVFDTFLSEALATSFLPLLTPVSTLAATWLYEGVGLLGRTMVGFFWDTFLDSFLGRRLVAALRGCEEVQQAFSHAKYYDLIL